MVARHNAFCLLAGIGALAIRIEMKNIQKFKEIWSNQTVGDIAYVTTLTDS